MSAYEVGKLVHQEYVHHVPQGAVMKRISPDYFEILELPEPTEAEKLAEELLQGYADLHPDTRLGLAEWILARFERKHAQGGYVLDREGDKWLPAQGGGYALRGVGTPWSVSDIRDRYGVDSRSPIQ